MTQEITSISAPFWEGLEDGEFQFQWCENCESFFFPPGPCCPNCGRDDFSWKQIDPIGSLYSFTCQHRTAPDFDNQIVMGIIELDVGPRLLTHIDATYESLTIGDRVKLIPSKYDASYDRGSLTNCPFFSAILAGDKTGDD